MRSAFGSITKRARNVYLLRWTDPTTKTRHSKTFHGTRAQAQQVLAQIQYSGSNGLKTALFSDYWEAMVEPTFSTLAPATVAQYRRLWRVELCPRLGCERVESLTWRRVQDVIDDIAAPSVQRKSLQLLKKVSNMAIRDGFLSSNPCNGIKTKQAPKQHKNVLTCAAIPSFLANIRGLKYEPLILVMLGGGLRPEEAHALHWSDVAALDYNARTYAAVRVDDVLTVVENKPVHMNKTKTVDSARVVVIGEPFAARLLDLKCAAVSTSPLCPGRGGNPTNPQTFLHNWKSWCTAHDVAYIQPKNFRASYATMMGEAGALDSLVSMSMGHTDGTTRGRHYQQSTLRGLCMIADLLAYAIDDKKGADVEPAPVFDDLFS